MHVECPVYVNFVVLKSPDVQDKLCTDRQDFLLSPHLMNVLNLLVMHREPCIDGFQVINLDKDNCPFTETNNKVIVHCGLV